MASTTISHPSRPIQQVALYARVSTPEQNARMQLDELRHYAAQRGFEVAGEFVDIGISGSKDSRPQLNRMMTAAGRRGIDAIVVWKLDRFGRSLKHLVNALADLESLGIAFISLRDNLDLSTPSGRLMFGIIASMAEFERELIRERVRAGMASARIRGRRLGRPIIARDAQNVAQLRGQGLSWSQICQKTGLSKGTAQRTAQRLSAVSCAAD